MSMREGIFLAKIGDHGVAPKGKNGYVAFSAEYIVEAELDEEGRYCQVEGDLRILKDYYLEGKDGLLEMNIRNLREATGWDGRDVFWLADELPVDTVVRITVGFDNPSDPKYKPKLEVKWINHKDFNGTQGVSKATDAERAAIKARMGVKLRAIAGGTPVKTPIPPVPTPPAPSAATSPVTVGVAMPENPTPGQNAPSATTTASPATASTAAKKPPGRPRKVEPAGATQEEAWAEFTRGIADGTDENHVSEEWARVLNEMFPGIPDDKLSPADWLKVKNEAGAKYIPM